ncbi:tyrosine-type recombinase/integrase [Nonomuraea wenchangensis]|uniref:Phage integrase family protein n=1 Tax=Nonomuraea wenchangensis TaxID=568860 RepID=A0A1I0G4U4_9ACTN|nr:tyrosine-type recombinase/integrase [Nonomuraea wenchangensis]SET65668.1 Phage integrase family protein [Nonomuraea wenchangensis]
MIWTPAQLRAFLATTQEHCLYAFFHLAAYTGARRGELLNLRWTDVDLDKPQIHITGAAAVIDRQRIEGTSKSGRSRVVSLDPSTVRALKAHRAHQDEERLRIGESWKGGGAYVFTTGWGDPLFPDTPSSLMPKLIKTHNKQNRRAQLPHARLHTSATSMPRRCSWPAYPFTSWRPDSATPTRRSPCGSTPTSSTSKPRQRQRSPPG